MREYTNNNITITYPDTTSYLYDNLFVKLEDASNNAIGAKIQVTDLASNQYRKLQYFGETPLLVFSLNDTIQSLYHDAISFNVVIDIYQNGFLVDSYGFDTDIMNGRTLPLRSHGSARTIYAYSENDLRKIGFIFPASGNLSVNGHGIPIIAGGYTSLDLRSYITETGTYQLCFHAGAKGDGGTSQSTVSIVNVADITPFSAEVQLWFADTSGDVPSGDKGGGVWKDDEFYLESYCMTLVYEEECPDFNFFETRYLDTDGIMRYLGGKIIEETTSASGDNFYRMDTSTVIRNISRRYISDSADTVKIGYQDLRRDSYWTDILLADKVEFLNYNGDWIECSVKTNKATATSDETMDVEIEYEILKG